MTSALVLVRSLLVVFLLGVVVAFVASLLSFVMAVVVVVVRHSFCQFLAEFEIQFLAF